MYFVLIIHLSVMLLVHSWNDAIETGNTKCADDEFKCDGEKCIDKKLMCDGMNDCGDWSDEDNPDCTCDWNYWVHYQGRCYKVFEDEVTWLGASRFCRNNKSNLTTIFGPDQEKFLANLSSVYMGPNETIVIYIGLRKRYDHKPGQFKQIFKWADKTPLIYTNWTDKDARGGPLERCTVMNGSDGWKNVFCGKNVTTLFICMRSRNRIYDRPVLPPSSSNVNYDLLEPCSNRELRSRFKKCDGEKDCTDNSDEEYCDAEVCGPDMYRCQNRKCISFTFYCDGINDCGDNSDEETCKKKSCDDTTGQWKCINGHCIDKTMKCDLNVDCLDESDERNCDVCPTMTCYDGRCLPRTWIGDDVIDCSGSKNEDEEGAKFEEYQKKSNFNVWYTSCTYQPDNFGKVVLTLPADNDCATVKCPDTYYKCSNSYCIPVLLVCNGLYDCPQGEEESGCGLPFSKDGFSCPGYYRCRGQGNCIDPSQVCDGIRHCLRGDDERHCTHQCPPACVCEGRAIKCDQSIPDSTFPVDVRKLDLSGVEIPSGTLELSNFFYLTVLNLSNCRLSDISGLFNNVQNVIDLDLSDNMIQTVDASTFSSLSELKFLDLSNNVNVRVEVGTFRKLFKLERLNLHNTSIGSLGDELFTELGNLQNLNLSSSKLTGISKDAFSKLKLRKLDIRQTNAEHFGCCFLKALGNIEHVYVDSYHLCCDFSRSLNLRSGNCKAERESIIASCENMVGEEPLRFIIWSIGVIATFGALIVFAYRCRFERKSFKEHYGVFLTSLSISDFLMGGCMLCIATADHMYKGQYNAKDFEWRSSYLCRGTGAVAMLSSEAFCMLVFLITFERFIAIKYPFGRVRFSCLTTTLLVVFSWILAVIIAGIPLLSAVDHWDFYSKNSICMAMPPNGLEGPGWLYSAAVFVGLNLSISLATGLFLISLCRELSSLSNKRMEKQAGDDEMSARKLVLVLVTDVLCWLSVGIISMNALRGKPPNKETYVWTLAAVIPMNAALNPLLYMTASIRELWVDSKKPKGRELYNPQDYLVPRHPSMEQSRAFVGNPTNSMVTLDDVMENDELPHTVKCGVVSLVTAFLYDLMHRRKRYEPIHGKNVFIDRSGEVIATVCLGLSSDKHRLKVTDDILYLLKKLVISQEKAK